jgi:hypothetical protein
VSLPQIIPESHIFRRGSYEKVAFRLSYDRASGFELSESFPQRFERGRSQSKLFLSFTSCGFLESLRCLNAATGSGPPLATAVLVLEQQDTALSVYHD